MAMVTGVEAGERVLWRGGPDSSKAMRSWLTDYVVGLGACGLGLAFFFVPFFGAVADGSGSQPVMPIFIGMTVIGALVQLPVGARRARSRAQTTSYTLTERWLIIDRPSGRTELRLANMPDLRLDSRSDGSGSISFSPPAGAGLERYVRRWSRTFQGRDQATDVIGPVPDAQHVFDLMRAAQAQSPTMSAAAGGAATPDGRAPTAWPNWPVADVEAPVARLSFSDNAASTPLWFSGIFVVAGLAIVAYVPLVGLLSRDLLGAFATGLPILGLGGCFALLGGVLWRARWRQETAQRRLAAAGRRVIGTVVDIAGTGVKVNRQELWTVRYRYELLGQSYEGHTPPLPWLTASRHATGDEVALLVDAQDPSVSVVADLDP